MKRSLLGPMFLILIFICPHQASAQEREAARQFFTKRIIGSKTTAEVSRWGRMSVLWRVLDRSCDIELKQGRLPVGCMEKLDLELSIGLGVKKDVIRRREFLSQQCIRVMRTKDVAIGELERAQKGLGRLLQCHAALKQKRDELLYLMEEDSPERYFFQIGG